jgi:hypothetical protein
LTKNQNKQIKKTNKIQKLVKNNEFLKSGAKFKPTTIPANWQDRWQSIAI